MFDKMKIFSYIIRRTFNSLYYYQFLHTFSGIQAGKLLTNIKATSHKDCAYIDLTKKGITNGRNRI